MCLVSLLYHHFLAVATIIAELLVAFVIFYEVEEHRATTFLADVQGPEFYKDRAKLYDAYACHTVGTLKERAEAFRLRLWADPDLREVCDLQWTYFNRLRYVLNRSLLNRRLLVIWFPQVLVSFWVMTGAYIRERQGLRPSPVADNLVKTVTESLKELKRRPGGFQPITIYSRDGEHRVVIAADELERMLKDAHAPFK